MSAIIRRGTGFHSSNLGVVETKIEGVRKEFPFTCAPKVYRLPSNLEGIFSYISGDYTKVVLKSTGAICSARTVGSLFKGLKKSLKMDLVLNILESGVSPNIFREVSFYPGGFYRALETSVGVIKAIEYKGVLMIQFPQQEGVVYIQCSSDKHISTTTSLLFEMFRGL